jgi:hypothetical protein
MSGDDRVTQTCAYLRMLLVRPGEYRTAWQKQTTGTLPDEIDYLAVGRVLGEAHLARPIPAEPALAETARGAL